MKKVIAMFVLISLTLSIVACGGSDNNIILCGSCNAQNALGSKYCSSCGQSINTSVSDKFDDNIDDTSNENNESKTTIELTKYNYTSYLSVSINMQSQTPTLISHNYYVMYYGSNDGYIIKSITPPTGSNIRHCSYVSSNYSLSTTFSVKAYSKDNNYTFENASFTLVYRSSSSSFSSVTIHLDNNGTGTNTFMVTEEVSSASKNYSYKVSDLISSAKGTVSYVE